MDRKIEITPRKQARSARLEITSKILRKVEPFVTAAVWCLVIFYFSNIPGLKSDFTNIFDFVFRKTAHLFEFAVLGYLLYRALTPVFFSKKYAIITTFILGALYAVSDEVHQLFVDNREGKIRDVIIDAAGILIVLFIIARSKLHTNKKTIKPKTKSV